ncbi:MAG: DEAD/DEAH box helicase, partial [Defluviitaleaceae bacterium]|nr:DEAD/DEAH box helicase [Defluviitaleaceae bacterium]
MKFYVDKNQIERLASNNAVYTQGLALQQCGNVQELTQVSQNDGILVIADVDEDETTSSANILFDKSGLLRRFYCSCAGFGVWRGGCCHVIALLLEIFDNNRNAATASRASRITKSLLDEFEKNAYTSVDERLFGNILPDNPTILTPTITLGQSRAISIEISIGHTSGRKYIVKDISKLLDAFSKEENVSYGKNFSLTHNPAFLDNSSKELLRILKNGTMLPPTPRYGSSYHNMQTVGRAAALSPSGLDSFFDLYRGQTVAADTTVFAYSNVTLEEKLPDINISIFPRKAGGAVLAIDGADGIIPFSGEVFGYLLKEDDSFEDATLYRVDREYIKTLQQLGRAFTDTGRGELVIPASEMQRLYTYVLPQLNKLGLLSSLEGDETTAKTLLPSAPSCRIYLDADGDDIVCEPTFIYGNSEIRPLSKFNEASGTTRDVISEYEFLKTLEIMGFIRDNDKHVLTMGNSDNIFNFYYGENGLAKLREITEIFATDAFSAVSRRPAAAPSFGLRINGSLLEIEVSGDYTPAELLQALDSYRLKKSYHKLPNGRYIGFDGSEYVFDEIDELFTGLDVSKKDIKKDTITVQNYRALYAADLVKSHGNELNFDEGVRRIVEDFIDITAKGTKKDFTLPASLANILRPYQKEGVRWLSTLSKYGFGGILADDMGLGKTLQVIALLLLYKENYSEKDRLPSIVVAPTSLIYNWEKEISRFAPDLNTAIISGMAAKRREDLYRSQENGIDVFITTYDMLKRDIDAYGDAPFRYVIADEAQNIKNPGTQNAKSVKRLNAAVRLALTGTPIENSLSELWSIFDFCMPGYLFSASKFTKTYESPILKNNCAKASAALRRQIQPFILRRLKTEVLTELPEKVETTLYADMTDEQKLLYEAYLLKTKGELEEIAAMGKEKRIEILSMLTRLRQICCHPSTFIDNYAGGSGKLDLTIETLLQSLAGGHRTLIFSQFTKMLAILCAQLDELSIPYFYLDGATPSRERMDMVERFNAGEYGVFLISLKAGGSGLNLTGADVVMHYDPWWNPAVMAQAADRAHRFGQTRMVQVFNIVAKDSIEEKIMALQGLKKDMVDKVIEDNGASFIGKLSPEEILE